MVNTNWRIEATKLGTLAMYLITKKLNVLKSRVSTWERHKKLQMRRDLQGIIEEIFRFGMELNHASPNQSSLERLKELKEKKEEN